MPTLIEDTPCSAPGRNFTANESASPTASEYTSVARTRMRLRSAGHWVGGFAGTAGILSIQTSDRGSHHGCVGSRWLEMAWDVWGWL
eukprot:7283939-Prymnesium_polylepis.1